MCRLAVIGSRWIRTGDPVDGNRHQRKADDRDDRTRDDRREKAQHLAEEVADDETSDAGKDGCAVDDLQACCSAAMRVGDDDHRRDGRERAALHDRQLRADEIADAQCLDNRGDTAGKEIGIDEIDEFLRRQMDGAREYERHGYGPGIHGQDMLERIDERFPPGELLINGMDGSSSIHDVFPLILARRNGSSIIDEACSRGLQDGSPYRAGADVPAGTLSRWRCRCRRPWSLRPRRASRGRAPLHRLRGNRR